MNLRDDSRYPCRVIPEVTNMDQIGEVASEQNQDMSPNPTQLKRVICGGNLISFPPGKNQQTSYPFGLHNHHAILGITIPFTTNSSSKRKCAANRECNRAVFAFHAKQSSPYHCMRASHIESRAVYMRTHLSNITELGDLSRRYNKKMNISNDYK